MSDLNRIKKNIQNRDWSSKTTKTNINYIKGKLKDFGLSVPKYLNQGKLTSKQIETNSKRILNAIESQQSINRKQGTNNTLEKAMKRLEKAVTKHNQLVAKRQIWLQRKYNMSNDQLNYLRGEEILVGGYKKISQNVTTRYDNTPFKIYNIDNMFFSDTNAVNRRIKDINKQNESLKISEIQKSLKYNSRVIDNSKKLLNIYVNDGYLRENEVSMILRELKRLNGMQQNAFYSLLMSTTPKSKYLISDDDMDDFTLNLNNKWLKLINQASEFLREE